MKYDRNKSLIENCLAKAEYYEKQGNKEKAKYFLELAEKAEETNKRIKLNSANPEKTKGSR